VIIHFPQRSAHPSSMSLYCDLVAVGLEKRGHEVRILSKLAVVESALGLWRRLLVHAPAVISTWPELWREHWRDPNTWIVNISQEYIPPFGRRRSINIIYDLIQIEYPRSRSVQFFYRTLVPRFARGAALNISVSKTTARQLAAMNVPSVVVYSEFQLPDKVAPQCSPASTRAYAACWVGTAAKHKNIADYLALASSMPDRLFAAILPAGHADVVRRTMTLPANVDCLSSLTSADYDAVLRSSDFLVSTSLSEGFGRPPADGALAGCDIVLTDIPIYRELYDGLAHFYTPGNVTQLIAIVATSPRNIGAEAYARIKGWNEQHKLVDVINGVIVAAA
jgi:glycosyltransferase involved in cell wall biosynthesis